MPKEEWGVKRICPTTGKRFYDLNKTPIVSPYTGEVVTMDGGKSRSLVSEKATAKQTGKDVDELEEDVILEEEEDDDDDFDNDLLEEDDDDSVSLDDIADVGGDDDDS